MASHHSSGVLVAGTVYVLMNHRYHVSRNVRTQWFFKHLNKKISLRHEQDIDKDSEISILSIYPQDPPTDWGPHNSYSFQYLITHSTNVMYLCRVNKAVYCIDMSPSISAVDIQHGLVMLDAIALAIRRSIEGVVTPFNVPGTTITFEPDLFVTVIVHTPFFITPAQQVLVQGWRVTADNVEEFLSAIVKQLEILEDTIADVSGPVHEEIDKIRIKQADSERLVGGLFEEAPEKQPSVSGTSMVSPDSGFINLLRFGMLALRLLPPTNLSNLIVVTDGMIALPDIHVVESVLSQLRSNAVAVSFLHVGSQFHPHACHGLVPYTEIMQFIASATVGAYIASPTKQVHSDSYNLYQEAFIMWSFRRKKSLQELQLHSIGDWNISNQCFYGNREPQLHVKKQCEEQFAGSLNSILCCRLHEGYMIKGVNLRDTDLEVTMILPWSTHIYIEYIITSEWPVNVSKNVIRFVVCVKAPYEFLHDVTCPMKKPFQSPYRQAVVSRFWCTLKTLSHTDILLSHLDSFPENSMAHTVPESIRNGMPLFYLPSNNAPPELSSSGSNCPQFAQFWRPVVLLEPSLWQKWLHTHRLGLILQPDRPLPHALHTMTSNSRVHILQCRQAEAALYSSLKKLTTFVLIENHSYIKIMPSLENDKGPTWFYIVRVTSKPPCAVIHIAFLGGTPGNLRHQVVESLRDAIKDLRIPQRADSLRKGDTSDNQLRSDVECCIVINKPLEKILIRYERMPCEFSTVIFPDGTQPVSDAKPLKPTSTLITTLSRYLHHKRSIWDVHTQSVSHNNMLPTMLTTLTRMRLQEGFRLAHCSAGIINMVMEVQMKCYDEDNPSTVSAGRIQPCIIQYVLFPPHMTSSSLRGSNSGDETIDDAETEVRTQLITECWIEPQHGVVTDSPQHRQYMNNLHYHQIAETIWRVDAECISNLLTFDHLQLMCHNQQILPPLAVDPSSLHRNPLENWPHAVAIEDERIHRVPFAYNLMNLLPKCPQAELLSSVFIQGMTDDWSTKNRSDAPNNLLMENLLAQLQELHHRELHLSERESSQLLDLIVGRSRDCDIHPIPFPSASNKLDGRKVSDTGSTDTCETVPAASDWARMISWATYSASLSSPLQGSSDDIKTSKQNLSKQSWSSKKQKPNVPKWRCFVKSMASTHCVLTFIPASFQDLKMLMLGSDTKMYKSYEVEQAKSVDPEPRPTIGSETSENLSSRLFLTSKGSSQQEMDSQFSEDDLVFDPISHVRDTLFEKMEPFRMRSSSWDPMKKQSEAQRLDLKRMRTSSVGAKMKPVGLNKKPFDGINESFVKSERGQQDTAKPIYGSLTLPIYVYDCPLSNLVDALIFKSGFERRPDIFQNQNSENLFSLLSENESISTPDEVDLHHHCRVLLQAFNKCFVLALFKSLHLNHKINENDIETAVKECEETLLEIDITKFIEVVCGYKKLSPNEQAEHLENSQSDTCLPIELIPLHKLMKQRFLEILAVCFKSVPTNPEYFFCCPPVQISRNDGLDLSTHRGSDQQEFDSLTLQSDTIEFSSHHNSIIGVWDRVGFESVQDDARTSLLSNMDSDSVSDFLNDIGDDLFPLFMYLVGTVRSSNFDSSIPVKLLPTCLGEFINEKAKSSLSSLDFSKLIVTLEMHCLTLPPAYPADLPTNEILNHPIQDVLNSSLSYMDCQPVTPSDSHYMGESGKSYDKLQHLPLLQHEAVNKCIKEIEWFLQDEISSFLLDSLPVTEPTITFVANHVASSDRRYSCIMNTVGLDFVFGPEHSLDRFIREFSQLKVHGHCLRKISDYYYLVKNPECSAASKTKNISYHSDQSHYSFDDDHYSFSKSGLSDIRGEWVDLDCKAFYLNKTYRWIQELNVYRSVMPNFWLILKIDEEKVTCYFHCRFLEINTEEVQHYKDIHLNILENIEGVCKTVNQTLLLHSLHETRMCDQLLEPETSEDIWKPVYMKPIEADGVDLDLRGTYSETTHKFRPGWFSCRVVWQTHFVLHPRLKTGPGKPGLSRAFQALRTVLNRFSVNNRTNMFVYQDSTGNNVFYLRLHENIRIPHKYPSAEEDNSPGSVSRSSSINSLTNKRLQDDTTQREMRPRLKSFGESVDMLSRQEEFLTLRVHGISEAGVEVTNELVQVLQNRLDDAVLEVVSVMLARNSMCKLTADDVHFIQKPHHKADHIIQFTIPKCAYESLEALSFYLKHNLLQFFFLPKYTDNRHTFQDYSQSEGSPSRINESNIYLYNQSPVSGNKGIACLAVALVDTNGNIVSDREASRLFVYCEPQPLDSAIFHSVQVRHCPDDDESSDSVPISGEVVVEVRLWKQGRVNMEILIQKLKNIVQYSLWDLMTENNLLNIQLTEESLCEDKTKGKLKMNKLLYETIPNWLQCGFDLNVPAVKTHSIELSTRHSVGITLREMNNLILIHETFTNIFYVNDESESAFILDSDFDVPSSSVCFIVSNHASQCFQSDSEKNQSLSEAFHRAQVNHNLAEQLDLKKYNVFIPRQRFLISIITNQKVIVYLYNWPKDRVENLTKLLTQLGLWLSARSSFLTGILTQKMGLFHNQPCIRKGSSPISFSDGSELDNLLAFNPNATPRKVPSGTMSNATQFLRDSEPIVMKKKHNSDPVVASVHQIMEIKSTNKREQQEKLHLMWQSMCGGVTPYIPLSEDTLQLFLRYSRILHYCLTPVLFHPRWRLQSAATRDYKLTQDSLLQISDNQRNDYSWHQTLCSNLSHEYKQYLQSLGYIPVQTAPSTPRKMGKVEKSLKLDEGTKCYLQKSLISGIIMIEISLSEPFFHIKLHSVECSRLQPKHMTSIIAQIVSNFLDECCRVTVQIHLHSFTYDYHLRCVEWCLTGVETALPQRYHVTRFLDEFLKYYPKAPNFSPSLAHSGSICVSNLSTPPMQLFHYLLSHSRDYDMDVASMMPENDFILVKHKRKVYKDLTEIKHNDFNVTVLVSHDLSSRVAIKLNYYIILTSNREFYPRGEAECKLGKFCTVTTANRGNSVTDTSNERGTTTGHSAEDLTCCEVQEIRPETIDYLGYYSSHEQLMQRIMIEESNTVRCHMEEMVNKGSVDCRIHLLWNKLLSHNSANSLSYAELFELKELAVIQKFSDLDSSLEPMLHQPLSWYQGLTKILTAKYAYDKFKTFTSPDNNYYHLLILHPRFLGGFVMLTLDFINNTGELSIVFRHADVVDKDVVVEDIHALVEGVVNACSFHLWNSLLTN